MLSTHSLIHGTLGVIGLTANSMLIAAIFLSRKNTLLQTYSLLLFNSAVTDLIASVTDAMTMIRIVVDKESIVYIYNGPCGQFSENICFLMYSLMLHLAMHSIALMAVSFWYRSIVLSGKGPTNMRLQTICLVVLSPSIILAVSIQLLWGSSPRDEILAILTRIYPHLDTNTLIITGNVSTLGLHTIASTLYMCILPILAYMIIISRRRDVRRILGTVTSMSSQTKAMHESLLMAMTIHALFPIFLIAGIGSFLLLSLGVPRNEFLESFATMGVTFPSAANPLLIFYFVTPLRRSLCPSTNSKLQKISR